MIVQRMCLLLMLEEVVDKTAAEIVKECWPEGELCAFLLKEQRSLKLAVRVIPLTEQPTCESRGTP
jgi:hypothetical protein